MIRKRRPWLGRGNSWKRSWRFSWIAGVALAGGGPAALGTAVSGCGSASDGGENGLRGGGGDMGLGGGGASGVNTDSGVRAGSGGNANSSGGNAGSGGTLSSGDGSTGGAAGTGGVGADGGQGEAGTTSDSDGGTGGDAGASEDAGSSACAGGHSLLASDATGSGRTGASGYGAVQFKTPTTTQIVELATTLTVPAKPTSSGTLYAWPGLEPLPNATNFNPIGQGVLQPVLTWGTSCGTYAPKNPTGWWIAPQYVNPYTLDQAFYGCAGGKSLDVGAGDALDITMSLKGTTWSQVIVDRQTGQMTTFDIDLMGQAQPWALFKIELPSQNKPTSDVVFTSTTLTFAAAEPMACQPSVRGTNDYFAAPEVSADGTKCCVSRMVLRAQGVPATTPNGP